MTSNKESVKAVDTSLNDLVAENDKIKETLKQRSELLITILKEKGISDTSNSIRENIEKVREIPSGTKLKLNNAVPEDELDVGEMPDVKKGTALAEIVQENYNIKSTLMHRINTLKGILSEKGIDTQANDLGTNIERIRDITAEESDEFPTPEGPGKWVDCQIPDTPFVGIGISAVTLDEYIYFLGGESTWGPYCPFNRRYNSITNSWEDRENMPNERAGFHAVVSDDKKIYCVGSIDYGRNNQDHDCYDHQTDTWTQKKSAPVNCTAHTGGFMDGKVYMFTLGPERRSSYVYDPVSDTWTSAPESIFSRFIPSGIVCKGKFYIIGGDAGSTSRGDENECFDPKTQMWTSLPFIPTKRREFSIACFGNAIYCAGGLEGDEYEMTTRMDIYDVKKQEWRLGASLPRIRTEHVSGTVGPLMYLFAGADVQFPPPYIESVDAFDPYGQN